METVYHLDLNRSAIEAARYALLPGDPDRVPRLARAFDPEARELARKREFVTYRGELAGQPVLVTSTGIGGPSASIAVEELARLGVRTFLRVGTTGAIQEGMEAGDVVITTGAVRHDGASDHYAPIEYPAVADFDVVTALVGAADELGIDRHVGISVSSATFYPGEERADGYGDHVLRRFRGATEEWRSLGALNYEMEGGTILTMCAALGLRAGCVTGVVNPAGGAIGPEQLGAGEDAAVRVGVEAMRRLVARATDG